MTTFLQPLRAISSVVSWSSCALRCPARASLQKSARSNIREKPGQIPAPPRAKPPSEHSKDPFPAANAAHAFPECRKAADMFLSITESRRGNLPPSALLTSRKASTGHVPESIQTKGGKPRSQLFHKPSRTTTRAILFPTSPVVLL